MVGLRGQPLIDHHLVQMRRAGISEVIIVLGYLGDKIRKHIGDGSRFGVNVSYVTQNATPGTGSALLSAQCCLDSGEFLACYGDVCFAEEKDFWENMAGEAGAVIAASRVPDCSTYGRLSTVDSDHSVRLAGIREKDGIHTPGLVNAGAFRLTWAIFDAVRETGTSSRGEVELTDAISSLLRRGVAFKVFILDAWTDVTSISDIAVAERIIGPEQ
jgi:dTDP-glucose pyrophosphorylase